MGEKTQEERNKELARKKSKVYEIQRAFKKLDREKYPGRHMEDTCEIKRDKDGNIKDCLE